MSSLSIYQKSIIELFGESPEGVNTLFKSVERNNQMYQQIADASRVLFDYNKEKQNLFCASFQHYLNAHYTILQNIPQHLYLVDSIGTIQQKVLYVMNNSQWTKPVPPAELRVLSYLANKVFVTATKCKHFKQITNPQFTAIDIYSLRAEIIERLKTMSSYASDLKNLSLTKYILMEQLCYIDCVCLIDEKNRLASSVNDISYLDKDSDEKISEASQVIARFLNNIGLKGKTEEIKMSLIHLYYLMFILPTYYTPSTDYKVEYIYEKKKEVVLNNVMALKSVLNHPTDKPLDTQKSILYSYALGILPCFFNTDTISEKDPLGSVLQDNLLGGLIGVDIQTDLKMAFIM